MSGEERQVASPSLAILSFWQGVVEIVLRLLAPVVSTRVCVHERMLVCVWVRTHAIVLLPTPRSIISAKVGSLPAFIAAIVALDTGKNNDDLNDLEMTNSREGDFDLVNDLVELRDNTYAGTGERCTNIHCMCTLVAAYMLLIQYIYNNAPNKAV